VDLLLAPPSPETAELVRPEHLPFIADQLSSMYDYIILDVDKRLDDVNLGVFEAAEVVFVVMTADLSCLKNVRLILETMHHLGYPPDKVQLVLNRSNAFTGINVKNAEGALRRTIDHQVVNEYRGAISALNSGAPFMFTKADSPLGASLLQFVRGVDKVAAAALAQPVGAR
jgi:pilus assembly protein CpaE